MNWKNKYKLLKDEFDFFIELVKDDKNLKCDHCENKVTCRFGPFRICSDCHEKEMKLCEEHIDILKNIWYLDCYELNDYNFPLNSFGPYNSLKDINKTILNILINPKSGIDEIRITKNSKGLNIRKE